DHVLDAVYLLLDRRDHGRGDNVGVGPGILARDVDGGRRDLRILRDRQARIRHAAHDQEHDRNDGGENRPIDEVVGDADGGAAQSVLSVALAAGTLACGEAACSSGVTFCPWRTRIKPLTTTRSPADTPSLITRMSPTS